MKKIQVLVISILFLTANVDASFLKSPQPYAFGPEGRTVADLRDFSKPVEAVSILPNRPVVTTDSSGARVYYSSSGKQLLTVSKDGKTSFSVGGVTKNRDKYGNITSITERQKGTNIAEVKNATGEIVGYKTLNGNGETLQEFDKDKNLTKTYNYDKFGKNVESIVNELTQEKTLYDQFGREKGVISIGFGGDGYVISCSQYEDVSYEISDDRKSILEVTNKNANSGTGLLVTKKDYSNAINSVCGDGTVNVTLSYSTTYFDKEGLTTKVVDGNGIVAQEYFYKKDNYGNKILTYVLDTKTKSKTYYENGKPIEERNDAGGLTKKYYYDGSQLLYTVSMTSAGTFGNVTYYDKAGKALGTTFKSVDYNDDMTIDFVCSTEYSVEISKEDIESNNLKEGTDYVVRKFKNVETSQLEDKYYKVPTGIEGINYVREEVQNDDTDSVDIKFKMISEKYYYTKDANGNKVIDYVVNMGDNTRTYYKNNKMYYTAANDESTRGIDISKTPNDPKLLKVYNWDVPLDYETDDNKASTLRYVFDTKTQTTQWFNAESKFVYLTYNDRVVSKNLYDNGKLVGQWNNQTKELTIFRDEKQWITLNLASKSNSSTMFEPDVVGITKILSFANGDVADYDKIKDVVNNFW